MAQNNFTTVQAVPRKSRYSFYQRLIFLYGLNLIDWFCTSVLLSSGRFVEANPVMSSVLNSFADTLLIKGVLPLALVIICALIFKLSKMEESRFANILLNIGIAAYSLVNLWHIINFLLLFSTF